MNSLITRVTLLFAFLAVGFGVNAQSINSTLNNRPGVAVGVEESFTVTLTPGALSPLTNVKLAIILATPAQSADINLSLLNPQTSQYENLIFDGSGNSISVAAPFFLVSPLSAKVTFSAPGVYDYSLQILDGTTNAVIANSDESVTVTAPLTAPTIFSSINGDTLTTGVQTSYSISTTTGDYAGTMIKVFFKMDPAQVGNGTTEYFEPMSSSWVPFNVGVNGEAIFGPGSGFPLANTSSQFRVTYNTPGVYNYKMAIVEAAAPNDTLAFANEHVVVEDPAPPTIFSTLNGLTLATGTQTQYEVSTTTGDYAGTLVKVFFEMDPAQVGNTAIEYFEVMSGTWMPFPIGVNGQATFGPGTGFPLANTGTQFRVTYDAPGVYNYKMSLFEAAAPNDTLAIANESVTVVDYIAPTILSTLDGLTVYTGDETDYQVTTTAGSEAGTLVRGFLKLEDATQTSDVNVSYETAPGVFTALPLDPNGTVAFGPSTGFPLADASTNFKVIFDAPGVYNYRLYIYEVANNDTLATADESVTVVDYIAPTIETTLDGLTIDVSTETPFELIATAGSEPGTSVKVFIELDDAAQTNDVNFSFESAPGVFTPLVFNANGQSDFGPISGFPLADSTINFKALFDAAGVYGYKLSLYDVATGDTLATSEESVTVVDPAPVVPEISSDLDLRTGVVVNVEENFTVTTVKNNAPNANVRIKITLANPAQRDSIDLSFENPATSTFEQLTFDASGIAYAGNTSGFPLADADYDFKISFIGGGLYEYNLALVEATGNTTLADKDEEVYVLDNSSIDESASIISKVFPNPTEGNVNIQTQGNGVGSLDVFTLTGKKVMNQTINGPLHSASLETLPAGMYIIKISQGGNTAVVRVVKK